MSSVKGLALIVLYFVLGFGGLYLLPQDDAFGRFVSILTLLVGIGETALLFKRK